MIAGRTSPPCIGRVRVLPQTPSDVSERTRNSRWRADEYVYTCRDEG
jgi:hypothetical protein